MDVEFGPKKAVMSNNIDVKVGSFALDVSPLKFETCRERFARNFDENTIGFFLKHPSDKGYNVACFLRKTECVLQQTEFSSFSETNRDTILWIEPCAFWKECQMRRSLLTILVRAGMVYDFKNDNYEEALFKQEYASPTRLAIQRFLFGFTKYNGPLDNNTSTLERRGWKTVFQGKSISDIKTMLVCPDRSYKPVFQGKESLWY